MCFFLISWCSFSSYADLWAQFKNSRMCLFSYTFLQAAWQWCLLALHNTTTRERSVHFRTSHRWACTACRGPSLIRRTTAKHWASSIISYWITHFSTQKWTTWPLGTDWCCCWTALETQLACVTRRLCKNVTPSTAHYIVKYCADGVLPRTVCSPLRSDLHDPTAGFPISPRAKIHSTSPLWKRFKYTEDHWSSIGH